ncbi:MAG: cobyrinic acid a,c-diamide synthase [Chloroflexus sp.]|jgi:chromosome partitioning protein|uniref:AAA family ATPase n=1 Tax=Chloroflexus sp. TaxID=1904827 RepID=UPI0021DE9423|nr:AAA family ATPase [Chloroflexus sp.]GIV89026.1 MAG: cobyrinic acid a,c-diamide synthase [Chloroflexus sp.]
MTRIVAVINLKGGIGKTTTVVNVSAGLALKGARVLLIDIDAQGNLAMALGVRPRRTLYEAIVDQKPLTDLRISARPNLDLIAADESLLLAQQAIAGRSDWVRVLEQLVRPVREEYDFIFFDCGGSLTVLNQNALIAATEIIIPTTVEPFSVRGLEKLITQIARVKGSTSVVRAIIPTMVDPRMRQSIDLLAHLNRTYGQLVLPPVRTNVRLSEASAVGKTIYEHDPRSRGALDYAQIVEVLSKMWNFQPTRPVSPRPLPNSTAKRPLVTGDGAVQSNTCPNCGHALRRANVAGYRITYCTHCRYRQQELITGAH